MSRDGRVEKHPWFPGIVGRDGEGQWFSIYKGEVEEHDTYDKAVSYLMERKTDGC